MAKKFSDLRQKMSPLAQAEAQERTQALSFNLQLQALRRRRDLTQAQVSAGMHVDQAAVSKLERRSDMYLSTLSSYVRAMGGQLRITVSFPDGEVTLNTEQPPYL